ncbi:3'-5' exonuclease [Inconstantimicrobium mannanitabidum]|uniref:Uncharacterized protein n=1 Tax=Inconstantimicrobium mannanitabidum TaxID=1604901 RepID=A0ACB5RAF8_9CLOT|nr:BRCT domain-containing protein [Clostridium sp. TW13]GKX66021.1 hypothetical protein rsdtw13_12790 [Clostridium sp. TW13]
MIIPKREWRTFESESEKIEKLKEWQLISPKAKEIKKFYYKGLYTNEPVECDVAGFVDDNEIILYINGQLHSIHPDYFADMQKKERFIILDIETPMSFRSQDGIREVALIAVEDYRIVDSLHLAIINDEEKYKNGYGAGLEAIEENEDLKEKFNAFISKYKCPIIAHNASFDRKFLMYWNWVDDKQEFYCSRDNIKAKEVLESYKLQDILNHYGIKREQAHNAMQDVLDLLEVLKIVKIEKWVALGKSTEGNTVKRVRNYENDKKKRDEDKKKLEEAKENIIKDIFNNKKIVFTGDMKEDRAEMRAIAIRYGATSPDSVSSKTDILVVGENAGSKLAKAQELGIKTISEEEFWDIVNEPVKESV